MSSRIGVVIMGAALFLYLAMSVWFAVLFLATGTAVSIGMGVALIVIAPIGAWALVRELMFGFSADRLGRILDGEGGMPQAPAERMPSGRLRVQDADPLIEQHLAAAERDAQDWRARYRLGVVQDAAGHRKDARASIREAIRLARARS
ncbi:hypothetical protein [Microbacterium suwonense]|uniref:Tetratricopeptide repeat protein n=1 Tax=Microbacterium suwonense TaxID=683047 RepID=A0ABN6X3H1_9MICO|nr:hypothetical protein [Microbacterium suwonense]BDZ38568.1 hypothetical protein GCM10025863_11820 [Microbacterium suwonense]